MAVKTNEPTRDEVRQKMLKNTAVVESYAEQIKSQIGELISLINEFQEGVSDGRS